MGGPCRPLGIDHKRLLQLLFVVDHVQCLLLEMSMVSLVSSYVHVHGYVDVGVLVAVLRLHLLLLGPLLGSGGRLENRHRDWGEDQSWIVSLL